MRKSLWLFTISGFIFLGGAAFGIKTAEAVGLKVATVDFQRAINETGAGKKADVELKAEAAEKQKKFEIMKQELEGQRQEFEKQRLVLTGKTLDDKRNSLQQKLMEIEKVGYTYEQELGQKRAERVQKIVEGLREVVQALGVAGKYDFIFEKSQGGVLFSQGAEDVTDAVVKQFNNKFK